MIQQDEHYLGLEHKAPTLWWGHPFIIVIKKGNNMIASARSLEEFNEDWNLIQILTNEEINNAVRAIFKKFDVAKN